MYSYHKDNRDFLIYFIFYAAFLHTYMVILPSKGKFYRIIYKADVNISFIMRMRCLVTGRIHPMLKAAGTARLTCTFS